MTFFFFVYSFVFALIEKIYQTLETAFHRRSKHFKFRQKYTPRRVVFSTLFSAVFEYPDETLSLVFDILRLPHTSRFFVVELQIFCRGQIGLKFVGTSACRTLADFLSRLTAFSLGAESISAMFEKRLVHVTLMTIPHWLRYARAPTNCLGPPHTSRQGPTRRFEI